MFKKEAKIMLALFISPLILLAVIIAPKFIEKSSVINEKQLKPKDDLVIYFKSGSLEIEQVALNNLFNKLDSSMFYMIQGFSCYNDRRSEEHLIARADRRAEVVRENLIKKGFPADKLETTAYSHSPECKVTLSIVEK